MYIYIYIYVYKNILLCREILYATLQRCNMIPAFFPRYYRLQGELGPGMGYGPGSWSFGMQPFVDVSFWIGKYPGNIKESLNNRFGWSLEFRFGFFFDVIIYLISNWNCEPLCWGSQALPSMLLEFTIFSDGATWQPCFFGACFFDFGMNPQDDHCHRP